MMPQLPPGFRRRALCVAVAACTAAAIAARLPAGAAERAPAPSSLTLANGMRVVVVEDRAAPVVQTALWYRFGAADELAGKTGLAHALAHMMFRGTPELSDAGLADLVSRLGARATATTANDYTVFRFLLPANKLNVALRVEADRMQHLPLGDAAWSDEKAAVLAEYDADLRDPLTRLYAQVCKAASPTPVCGLSALGERDDIVRAGAQDLRAYYRAHYGPGAATLVVAGDVKAADVFALASAAFGAIPAGEARPGPVPASSSAGRRRVTLSGDLPYEVADLAFAVPGTCDPGGDAVRIVDAVAASERSEFHRVLIHGGRALAYWTQLDQNAHSGLFHVFLVAAPGRSAADAADAFAGVMRTAGELGFSSDLIRAAKTALAARAVYAGDSVATLGDRVGYAAAVEGIADPASDDARIAALPDSDVTAAVRRYFEVPAATGLLQPGRGNPAGAPSPPIASVSDDFGRRAPQGKPVQAPWAREALQGPLALASRVEPTAFLLANGIRVLVQPVRTNPTLFIQGTVESSPRFDPPSKEGTGAMLSALLSFGSANFAVDARDVLLDDLGATLHLGMDFDGHSRTQDWPALAAVIADALQHPNLAAADVEVVRSRMLGAVRERDRDPDDRANADFDRLLLRPDDPELREPSVESVRAVSAADLRAYAGRYLRPDLTTIAVVGDVDADGVRKTLQAAFGAWHATSPKPDLGSGSPPRSGGGARYVVAERSFVEAHLGQPALPRTSPDFYEFNVIDELLGTGGRPGTRLMDALRTKRDLVYGASSSLVADRFRGTLNVRFAADPKKTRQAVEVVREQLARFRDEPVDPFELERAKMTIVARDLVGQESTAAVALRVHDIGIDRLPPDYETTLAARYGRIGSTDILRVAREYLTPQSLVEVYEGPRP